MRCSCLLLWEADSRRGWGAGFKGRQDGDWGAGAATSAARDSGQSQESKERWSTTTTTRTRYQSESVDLVRKNLHEQKKRKKIARANQLRTTTSREKIPLPASNRTLLPVALPVCDEHRDGVRLLKRGGGWGWVGSALFYSELFFLGLVVSAPPLNTSEAKRKENERRNNQRFIPPPRITTRNLTPCD